MFLKINLVTIKSEMKIIKTKEFKEQEKNLPKNVKKSLERVLKEIAKNPTKMKGSMSLFGDASPEELRQWMGNIKPTTIDLVFEYLHDKNCLNKIGNLLAHNFWKMYIQLNKQKK